MTGTSIWLRFVLAVLATWRITHLLAAEDGPADVIVRLRRRLGRSFAGRLMDCFYCLSVWVAAPLAFFAGGQGAAELFVTWWALAGAACLLERLGQQPVWMQPLPPVEESKGDSENVLRRRSENGDTASHEPASSGGGANGGPAH
jgi:Protein of unknown function (DUF1360)